MIPASRVIRIGSRASDLARWQAQSVKQALINRWPALEIELMTVTTQGDRLLDQPLPEIGGKGVFTLEIENGLREGQIDMAVHSLKDLPTEASPGLTIGAIPSRGDARDVLVSNGHQRLLDLPQGASIGTSSLRREAQLLRMRPDLVIRSIRGNVETRVSKVTAGKYDAALMAAAGINRLGLQAHIVETFPIEQVMPAPGQAALAVQCRQDDDRVLSLLTGIDQTAIRSAVEAERAFLARLGAGCSAPIGAFASARNGAIHLDTVVYLSSDNDPIRVSGQGLDPEVLGSELAESALSLGAGEAFTGA